MLVVGLESRYKVDEISDAMVPGKARIGCFEEEQTVCIWIHFVGRVIMNGETIYIHLRRHLSASNSKKKR